MDASRAMSALRILYRDAWIIAVDKPADVIVHGDGTGTITLIDLLRNRLGDDAPAGQLQPLQRLDRETTGIVLFSACKDTQASFDRLIAERRISKRYLAIVAGRFPNQPQTYRGPLGRDRHDSRRMRVSRTGKPALTRARLLAYAASDRHGPARSLLAVDLLTGRKHQIRVHLSDAGFPLLGDELYGRRRATGDAGLMLHAYEESFEHPVTGAHVHVRAPYPVRFEPLFPASLKPL